MNNEAINNTTKQIILDRLFDSSAICGSCGRKKCEHKGNQFLPDKLNLADVLKAINLDEYFFQEAG